MSSAISPPPELLLEPCLADRDAQPARRQAEPIGRGAGTNLRHAVEDAAARSTEHEKAAPLELDVRERPGAAVDSGEPERARVPEADRDDRRGRRLLTVLVQP